MTTGRIGIHRSFWRDIERDVAKLPNARVHQLGILSHGLHRYPLLCVESESPPKKQDERIPVLISGGIHGNEPAGAYAALEFLRDVAHGLESYFRFFVLPCVNPSGYEADTLESMSGANLNRCFGCESNELEVKLIEAWLAKIGVRFRVTFDLHEAPPGYVGEGFVESDNPSGTWLYETVTDGSARIGRQMIDALPDDTEVCQWPTIYQDINEGGVVPYPEGCRNAVYAQGTTLDAFLNGRWTGHSFTSETPTDWPMERRIQTHLIYLSTALSAIAKVSPQPGHLGSRSRETSDAR